MVFPCRQVIFSMVFSHLGSGCKGSQNSKQQQEEKAAKIIHFLWVSEVTLGIFGVQFWGFSVLQRHGVSLVFSHLGTGCKGSQNS